MAFVFDNIQNILNSQAPENNDIFNPNAGKQQQGGGTQGQNTATSDVTSNQGTSLTPGSVSSSSSNTTSTGANNGSKQAAYAANVGQTGTPSAVNYASDQLANQQKALQDSANSYYNNQMANQNYDVSKDTINSAVNTGNQNDFSAVSGLLNRGTINQVGSYVPPSISVPEIEELKTPAGQTQLVSRGQGASYTPGEAALDVASLQGNPEFTNLSNQLQKKYSDLQNQALSLPAQEQAQVATAGQANLTAAQQAAKDYLNSQQQNILQAEEQQAQAQNQAIKEGLSTAQQSALQQGLTGAQAALQASSPMASSYIDPTKLDLSKYVTPNYVGQYLPNATEAGQYNNIQSLLGLGNTQQAAVTPESYYTNQGNIASDLQNQALATWAPIEQGYQSQEQAILNPLNEQANQYNAQLTPAVQEQLANAQFNNVLASIPKEYQPELNTLQSSIAGLEGYGINPSQYAKFNTSPVTANSYLNQDQAKQLNDLQAKLGQQQTYAAGAGAPPQLSSYDTPAAYNAIMNLLYKNNNNYATIQNGNAVNPGAPGQLIIPSPYADANQLGSSNVGLPNPYAQNNTNPNNGLLPGQVVLGRY